jgi:2,5-diketo-D-gluconate reductase A
MLLFSSLLGGLAGDVLQPSDDAVAAESAAITTVPTVALSNGVALPMLGFGTWTLPDDQAETLVTRTLSMANPPSIDTSPDYKNQPAVKRGLAGRPRDTFLVTSKINGDQRWTPDVVYTKSTEQLELNLKELGVSSVDLMLIHYPVDSFYGPEAACAVHREMWRAMEDFYFQKKARSIGVSNFCPSTFACLASNTSVYPQVNQVNFHVGMGPDPGGISSFCKGKGVQLQAYSVLGAASHVREILTSPVLQRIGQAHQVSAATVAERWAVQHGVAIVTTTTNADHMAQALASFSFTLSDAEMAELDALTLGGGHGQGPGGADYSFVCEQ